MVDADKKNNARSKVLGWLPESIWFVEKTNYREKNGSNVLGWIPPFTGQLSTLRIVYWWMQDRYTQIPILIKIEIYLTINILK